MVKDASGHMQEKEEHMNKANTAGKEIRADGIFLFSRHGLFTVYNQISDATYKNYKGDKSRIVLKTENPAFHPFEVGSHKRDMDSECKMFEYVSNTI